MMRRRLPLQHLFIIVVVLALFSNLLSILVHQNKDRDINDSQWININGQKRTSRHKKGKKSHKNKKKHSKTLPPSCISQYQTLNSNRTHGLSTESLSRSRAWIGNTERLYHFTNALYTNTKPLTILVCGGSISLGWGLQNNANRYSNRLQSWLDDNFPHGGHNVINAGVHGADTCSLAKRLRKLLSSLQTDDDIIPDLIILEYAVNDYQGQDDIMDIDHKMDVFFSGFDQLATCAEVVIYTILQSLPSTTAVVFLEFRTAIRGRKTAQLLHMGVAQHYEIPVVSYSEAMIHEFFHIGEMLNATESFAFDPGRVERFDYNNGVREETSYLLPYPYGCSSCRVDDIQKEFREGKCKSICVFMERSGVSCDDKKRPDGYESCFVPMFGPDAVHPSSVGHGIATDLIIHALTSVGRDYVCGGWEFMEHVMPRMGWIVGSMKSLRARGNFIMVNDTMQMGVNKMDHLIPSSKTTGWSLYSDVKFFNKKVGWISTSTNAHEHITFTINLPQTITTPYNNNTPQTACYVIYLAVLRSYKGMGKFAIDVTDEATGHTTTHTADGLWEAPISVWSDIQVTRDEDREACTGWCSVRVRTLPQMPEREGNKVKILTLSVRECEV